MASENDKWISFNAKTGKLAIRFRVRGQRKQFYLGTGLKDNKTNRDVVCARVEIIQRDIALKRFDSTLESYKFGNYKNPVILLNKLFLGEVWEKFVYFQKQHLEKSTLEAEYKSITKVISELSNQSLEDAVIIRALLLEKYSYYTAHKTLAAFSRCCKWGVDSALIESNPFEKVQLPKPRKQSNEDENKAYTLKQRDLIIKAFESHLKFSHYGNLVKFLFWTGCRPGEAFALTWGDISLDCTRISISKAYASRVHLLKGTKNNKRRVFLSSQGTKLQLLLLELRPDLPDPKQLIFKRSSGQRMNLRISDRFWRGYSTKGYHYNGVVADLAEQGIIPYLSFYSTRHTFATWAIASGISPEKVAYWLGDNVQTVLEYYCHPDVTKAECPDF
jgi:integrase